jgi:hypothetical protein
VPEESQMRQVVITMSQQQNIGNVCGENDGYR